LNDSGLCVNEVGEGDSELVDKIEPLDSEGKASFKIVAHSKAIRRTSAYFKIGIGDREITTLCIVSTWLWMKQQEAGAQDQIVDWSGYARGWKSRIYNGIRDCIKVGLIEQLPVKGGKRIAITTKGERVLDVYEKFCESIEQEFQFRNITAKLEQETKRLKAERLKALRAEGKK
jgi:hypothetical protein